MVRTLYLALLGVVLLCLGMARPPQEERTWAPAPELGGFSGATSLHEVYERCGWDAAVFLALAGNPRDYIASCKHTTYVNGSRTLTFVTITTGLGTNLDEIKGVVWQRSRPLPPLVRVISDTSNSPPGLTYLMAARLMTPEIPGNYTQVDFWETGRDAEDGSNVRCLLRPRIHLRSAGSSLYWTVEPPHEDYRCRAVGRSDLTADHELPTFRLSGRIQVHVLRSGVPNARRGGNRDRHDYSGLQVEPVE